MHPPTQIRRTYKQIICKDLSYELVGVFYKTHDALGQYAREKQYGDMLEKELEEKRLYFEREKLISRIGIDKNRADFVVENKILIELKAKPAITREDYYQVQRYLEILNLRLGIIVNFRQRYLNPKRVVNKYHNP